MAKLRARMQKLRLGDSLDKALDMGAIVDESQRRSIQEYVDDARKEGAEVNGQAFGERISGKMSIWLVMMILFGLVATGFWRRVFVLFVGSVDVLSFLFVIFSVNFIFWIF